jgi:CHAT domain-containing protein
MKIYRDFEIQISSVGPDQYLLFASGPGGDARSSITLPTADPAYQALAARLAAFDTDELALLDLGQILFKVIFQGPIKDVYTRSQSTLRADEGMRLRLNIDLEKEAEVAALPWEFLCDPDQGPLAMLDTPIVRYLPQQAVIPGLTTPLPLKILLTGAQTLPPAEIDRELHEVEAALIALGDNVKITVEPHLTAAKLRALLREGFHVWHFIGHGGVSRDGASSVLQFEDASSDTANVSARELGILLQRSGLRLVVLNACNSGTLMVDPFRSLAPALIRAQIPAVVAMQFTVPQEAARAFAREFYQALSTGLPIDTCVTEGRKAVMDVAGLRRADWGIPVVYTRAPDGKLFELPVPAPPAIAPIPGTAIGYSSSVGEGLSALRTLLQIAPGVQESAVRFRADFQVACEQIDLLGDYKDIHDQLHSLQFHCYNCIVQETKRATDDDLAWDTLVDYELTFQDIVSRLQDISVQSAPSAVAVSQGGVDTLGIARATLPPHETAWIQELVQAHQELHNAIENADARSLKRSIRLINRVLTIQPSQINARLNTTVRTLRLPSLAQALGNIRDQLSLPNLDAEKVNQFGVGVAALADLNVNLDALVTSHDRWQAIDLELRRIENTLDQDIGELELSWPDLKLMIEPLCADTTAPWAAALIADGAKLESAIETGEPNKIKQCFRRYRRQAGDRFYRVDIDLKRTCDDLRKIVEPLASVLRMIA